MLLYFTSYSQKAGNKLYKQWCSIWEKEAGDKIPPRATQFMADMWLPVYVQCTDEKCLRWRKLPSHIELHHVKQDLVKCNDCSIPEDKVRMLTMSNQCEWKGGFPCS